MKFLLLALFCVSVLVSQNVRICLIDSEEPVELKIKNGAVLYAEEGRYKLTDVNAPIFVYPKNGLIVIECRGKVKRYFKFKNTKDFYLKPLRSNSTITIGPAFIERQPLYFTRDETKVNIITTRHIEEYLEYVVPNEILTHKENYFEAIKAQTIAARTYTLNQINSEKDFDVYADVRDQVYKSNISVPEDVKKAVQETKGMVLTFEGRLIHAKYCSNLGGLSEAFDAIGNTAPLSMKLASGKTVGNRSSYYRWRHTFSKTMLLNRFNAWFQTKKNENDEVLRELKIEVLERSRSGRVETLKMVLNENEVILEKLEIRKFFHTDQKILPSRLISFEQTSDSLIIRGGGNGHGIGMGQWEAMELSELGYTHIQILNFFYPSCDLEKVRK